MTSTIDSLRQEDHVVLLDSVPHPAADAADPFIVASDQYLRGDESNQNPKIPGYVVVNLNSSYEINDHVELFGRVTNLFGAQYETFGAVFDPSTIPSLNLSTPRSLSPAPPRAAWIGVRASF